MSDVVITKELWFFGALSVYFYALYLKKDDRRARSILLLLPFCQIMKCFESYSELYYNFLNV